jgi:hypothetical protein
MVATCRGRFYVAHDSCTSSGELEPVESVELSRSRVRNGRSATRASPATYPRHDSNVHKLGLGQLPLPVGLRGPGRRGPGADPDADGRVGRPGRPARPQSQRSVLTGDRRAYETREVAIPPRCVVSRVVRPRVNEENRTPCEVGHIHLPLHPAPSTRWAVAPRCIREVLTLRHPRCERGALPLSYGCVERSSRATETAPWCVPNARSARLVSNEAFRCIRAASSPADSGPLIFG